MAKPLETSEEDVEKSDKTKKEEEIASSSTEISTEDNSDHLTKIIGIFGPFHAVFYFITALVYCLHCWQMMSNKFYTYPTDYWCVRPESHAHFTQGA